MKRTIGIIGMGSVGSSVAISVLHSGLADELLLHDVNEDRAWGEALDLAQGAAFYASCKVKVAKPPEMNEAAAVVITAGRNGKPGESRLDLLADNIETIRKLGHDLAEFRGLVVIVSNPVDIMTYEFQRASDLPPEQVIGTGTMLDTARLRQMLGQKLDLDPRSIHAQVIGEHGDSEVVVWSEAHLGGLPLRQWPAWQKSMESETALEVRQAAQEIIKRKGATNHAIGLVTASLLKWALRGTRRILTISRVQNGIYGISDVALSLPTLIGAKGATTILEPKLDNTEKVALLESAEKIRAAQARFAS